jgi:hypothetical protein
MVNNKNEHTLIQTNGSAKVKAKNGSTSLVSTDGSTNLISASNGSFKIINQADGKRNGISIKKESICFQHNNNRRCIHI